MSEFYLVLDCLVLKFLVLLVKGLSFIVYRTILFNFHYNRLWILIYVPWQDSWNTVRLFRGWWRDKLITEMYMLDIIMMSNLWHPIWLPYNSHFLRSNGNWVEIRSYWYELFIEWTYWSPTLQCFYSCSLIMFIEGSLVMHIWPPFYYLWKKWLFPLLLLPSGW